MGEYNYSPLFLKAHEELVRQLIALAREGRVASVAFEDHDDARRYRNLVLNLKRSLAINHPDMLDVHNVLRTAIGRDETGQWVIHIGPDSMIRNALRGNAAGRQLRGARYPMGGYASAPTTLEVPALAERKDLFPLADILARRRPELEVVVSTVPPQAALDYLAQWRDEMTGRSWEVLETSPKLRLRVREASATSALPSQS